MKKLFYLLFGLVLIGCSAKSAEHSTIIVDQSVNGDMDYDVMIEAEPAQKMSRMVSYRSRAMEERNVPADIEVRMITYTATVELDVDEDKLESGKKAITDKVSEFKGYVEEERKDRMVVFVDAARLDDFIDFLGKDIGEIEEKSKVGRDVTDSHANTAADLESAKAARDSYKALLKKATKVEDILKIEKELERINREILKLERAKERIEKSVRLSKVTIIFDNYATSNISRALGGILAIGGILLLLLL